MRSRPAIALALLVMFSGTAAAQTEQYTWAGVANATDWYYGQFGQFSWNNTQTGYNYGYPGFTTADTATFTAYNTNGTSMPNVNRNPDNGATTYTFATLTVDNRGTQGGWTFSSDGTSLTLLGAGSNPVVGLTTLGNTASTGNTTVFANPFVVGAAQAWNLGGNATFNGNVDRGANALTLALGDATSGAAATATFASAIASTGGALSVSGVGTIAYPSASTLTVAGDITPGFGTGGVGTLAFGTSTATITSNVSGAYNFDLTGAGNSAAFNSGASGGTHDLLSAFGTLNFQSGATVNINAVAGSTFNNTLTYSWLIASANGGSLTGTPTLNNKSGEFASVAGGEFSVNALNGSVFLNFTPAPEPGVALGAAAAGVGLAGLTRRRRRATGEAP